MRSNGSSNALVAVIGTNRQFAYYATPGQARVLLRDGDARIFSHVPMCLQLHPGAQGLPPGERFFFRLPEEPVRVHDPQNIFSTVFIAAKATSYVREGRAVVLSYDPPTIRLQPKPAGIRRDTVLRRPQMEKHRYLDSKGDIVNWTEFWREERDIYIQNLSDTQISVQIRLRNGDYEHMLVPRSPDPMNLTSLASFEDLKSSQDIRKSLNMRDRKSGQRLVRVMEEEDYRAYFDLKAKAMQITSDEAINRAERARQMYREAVPDARVPEPIHRVVEEGSGVMGATHLGERTRVESTGGIVNEEDVIRDPVRILMYNLQLDINAETAQVQSAGGQFNSDKVMSASKVLGAVQNMRNLNADELEHIRAKGFWPSVKRWASMEIQKIHEVPSMGEIPVAGDDGDAFIRRQAMTE